MEKKRSIVIRAIGILPLLLAIDSLWRVYVLFHKGISYIYSDALWGIFALLCSIGLFMLKEWGRKLSLAFGTYFFLAGMYASIRLTCYLNQPKQTCILWIILPLAALFLLWWFFTRPKVKEQFK